MELNEQTYLTLLQRYRELFQPTNPTGPKEMWEYPIDTFITETGTGTIDAEYIDSKFRKYIKTLYTEGPNSALTKEAREELSKMFATLSQKDQSTALIILHDIQSGDLHLDQGKTIYDYIAEYQITELRKQIANLSEATGLNESQLINLMSSDVNEQNLNDFNRYENLKLTFNLQKTRTFLTKILGQPVPPFLVMPKADQILRRFILDPISRENILKAWYNDDVTLSNIESAAIEEPTRPATVEEKPKEEAASAFDSDKIKCSIRGILKVMLAGVSKYMRPEDEVLDSVFYVLRRKSLESLDGVEVFISRAFSNLFVKTPTIVDKFVSFNLLVTKFEAYLRKLYYLTNGQEVEPQYEGDAVTWKDVIHGFPCLWNLKYNEDEEYQKLHQYLLMVKGWRNNESHISPTASEQEVDLAINIVISLYFFATGSCITKLECAEHDAESCGRNPFVAHRSMRYTLESENGDLPMAAESDTIANLEHL